MSLRVQSCVYNLQKNKLNAVTKRSTGVLFVFRMYADKFCTSIVRKRMWYTPP